jgi:hypothetical protein
MRRFMVILAVCGLVLLAFSATADAGKKARPFKGYVTGTCTFTFAPGDSPTGVWAQPYGVGTVSHLGKSVMTGQHPAAFNFSDGHMTLVAANGDKVNMDYYGEGPDPTGMELGQAFDVWVKYTIVGGTGRFAHASGGGDMTVTLTFMGFPADPTGFPVVWPEVCSWRGGTIRY